MGDTVIGSGSMTLEIKLGSTIGSWEIVDLLGKGAMGRVYRARHVRLGREVALKVLNPEFVARPDVVQRFFREARVVNDIDHQNIVEVSDFVEQPGLAYLVMELLDGNSLRDLLDLKGRKYPQVKRLLPILRQVCDALDAAHGKGVVHRDLKPDNVFVVKRDGADFVKVLDFGVAKLRGGDDMAETTTGMIIGTPHYMSPEQVLGRDVTKATDIWAAGVVLFEALAGEIPFAGGSFVELANQIRLQPPKPLPKKTPRGEKIPGWLGDVIAKCLEKKPADRYKSMAALGEALAGGGRVRSFGFPWWILKPAAALAIVAALAVVAIRLDVPARAQATFERARRGLQTVVDERRAALAPEKAPHREAAPAPARREPAPEPEKSPAPAASKLPATVELSLRSSPSGARVVRLDTGARLGRTPLSLRVPRKAATVWIQMTLDGYKPIKFTVDLRKDNSANVTFQGVKRTRRR